VLSSIYPQNRELRHLGYFVAVAAELHFARAAQRLFISQPALSQQLRSLQGELGLQLLERNRRGVRLTPAGEAFLTEATAVVQQADRALEVARALAEGATGRLRLSYVRTMPGGLPERIVSEYRRRFTRVEITADFGATAPACTTVACPRSTVPPGHRSYARNRPGERILVAVAAGTGITLLVEERAVTLRYPGVTFRRFADRRFIDPRLVDRPRL
jgi:DNA-binding transcriptional LysR family regulator